MNIYCGTPEARKKADIHHRKNNLQCLFKSVFEASMQSGVSFNRSITMAAYAVDHADDYDEAMKIAVEARLRAEFPEPTHDPE